jgi:hypothetical protein
MIAFGNEITRQVRELISDREADILHAWHENIEEAQSNEDKFPPLKLSIAATVDLEGAKIETALTFTTRYKTTKSSPLPDPNQPDLTGFLDAIPSGGSVTIETGGKSVEITQFTRKGGKA